MPLHNNDEVNHVDFRSNRIHIHLRAEVDRIIFMTRCIYTEANKQRELAAITQNRNLVLQAKLLSIV